MVFGDSGFTVPETLQTNRFLIRPLRATDVELDYAAVMESRENLRLWEQSTWPADDFTLDGNLADLQRHEREHLERVSFTYTVMNPTQTECLGCVYIYPTTARWLEGAEVVPMGDAVWADHEAVISFWIRTSRLTENLDRTLLATLRQWFDRAWQFDGHLFMTNEQFTQQVAMIDETDLRCRFEAQLGLDPGKFGFYA